MKAIRIDDLTMHVVDEGQGTPLLFVHGFPLDHSMWENQITRFSSSCRVIAPDLRGFGRSGVTDGVVGMDRHADDLNRVLDELNVAEPVIYCGLSMGGYVGWQFWRSYPLRVAAIIAADTRAVADSPRAAAGRREMAEQLLNQGSVVAVDTMLPKLFAPHTYEQKPELVENVRQCILRTDPVGLAASQRGMALRADASPWLREIDVPVLFVAGQHDQISTPAEMEQLANAVEGGTFQTVAEAGHLSPLENPSEFNHILEEFLSS